MTARAAVTDIHKLSCHEVAALTADPVEGMTDNDRDEMAIPSYRHSNPLIRWLMWRRYEVIARLGRFSPETDVLEFGCGIGLFLPTLAARCRTVHAADLFPQYVWRLAGRYELDIRFLPAIDAFDDRSVDAIVAADVLEHVDDLRGWVRRFHDKLRPGGVALVSGPTQSPAYRLGRVLAGFAGKGEYHHTNIGAIRRVFEESGFATTDRVTLPFPWLPALFKVFRFCRE